MVVLVHVDGLAVEGDGALEVPGLARRVALPHLLQEQRLVGLARAAAAAAGPRIFALQSGG